MTGLVMLLAAACVSQDRPTATALSAGQSSQQKAARHEPDRFAGQREKLSAAITKPDAYAATLAYRELRDAGAAFERAEFERVLRSVLELSWQWGPNRGADRVRLWSPLDGVLDGTAFEFQVRAEHAIGLMESGQREAALELWTHSQPEIIAHWDRLKGNTDDDSMDHKRRLEQALGRFGIALVASTNPEEQRLGVEAALKQLDRARESAKQRAVATRILAPHVKAHAEAIFCDSAIVNLGYCLMASGLSSDPKLNPLLANEAKTSLRFAKHPTSSTGLPRSNRIALGDYDGDGYCDVFLPGAGLWRNRRGNGKFERVDQKLGLAIRGQAGALVDLAQDRKSTRLNSSH